jgi:hypothetical protein
MRAAAEQAKRGDFAFAESLGYAPGALAVPASSS